MFHPLILATSLLSLTLTTTAFSVRASDVQGCRGTGVSATMSVDGGCQAGMTQIGSLNIGWSADTDNDLVVVLYTDDKCCHAAQAETLDWSDVCQQAPDGVKSWRVVDPNDPGKGKQGEDYECKK
ncbi:hypothetical protein BDV95DRAFT_609742 [Massariosphaeria phaeospora]|uniref:Secreted protein n=1 Tax=Massariosphaeria phaeospora TaxID=100035 RepID=A0A7C8M6M3_9PLEO|nr:hypothetical protein BDV95DRAFT_609742 [Massariosphaeria phaeospora]